MPDSGFLLNLLRVVCSGCVWMWQRRRLRVRMHRGKLLNLTRIKSALEHDWIRQRLASRSRVLDKHVRLKSVYADRFDRFCFFLLQQRKLSLTHLLPRMFQKLLPFVIKSTTHAQKNNNSSVVWRVFVIAQGYKRENEIFWIDFKHLTNYLICLWYFNCEAWS